MRSSRRSSATPLDNNITILGVIHRRKPNPVYLVWNHKSWCPMACKVYDSHARAKREASMLRSFQHPNIVRWLGTGKAGYMLMEFLEGPTLDDYIGSQPRGRLSQSDAIRIAIYLGSALIHIHSKGYLHLDIKPANVILFRGRPILFDLDIAMPRSWKGGAPQTGTAEYMSPEQRAGSMPTTASDVFSLGVSLYEALSGELPFSRARGRGRYFRPTALTHYLPETPFQLERLLARCLAPLPEDRPELPELLLKLHDFISEGAKMWPDGFAPAVI